MTLWACVPPAPSAPSTAPILPAIVLSVEEVVSLNPGSSGYGEWTAICLGIGEFYISPGGRFPAPLIHPQDPPPELLAVLQHMRLPVVPHSYCSEDPQREHLVVGPDDQSPALGIRYAVRATPATEHLEILVDAVSHGRNAGGYICTLNREDEAWQLQACRRNWRA